MSVIQANWRNSISVVVVIAMIIVGVARIIAVGAAVVETTRAA